MNSLGADKDTYFIQSEGFPGIEYNKSQPLYEKELTGKELCEFF
jgi:hypothetical protein